MQALRQQTGNKSGERLASPFAGPYIVADCAAPPCLLTEQGSNINYTLVRSRRHIEQQNKRT